MTSKGHRPERPLERLARRIVATELGVRVDRYDFGTSPSQPDGVIHLAAGDAPLEVVSDEDSAFNSQHAHLVERGGLLRTNLPGAWIVWLRSNARLKTLDRQLPALLAGLKPGLFGTDYHLTNELAALHVVSVNKLPLEEPGLVLLRHEGWNSWDDPIAFNPWVTRVLYKNADVASKLAAHGGIERHAFVWAHISSAWNVNATLREDTEIVTVPPSGPPLPEGITHLWVASTLTRRGALLLHDGLWRRTGWITTEDVGV